MRFLLARYVTVSLSGFRAPGSEFLGLVPGFGLRSRLRGAGLAFEGLACPAAPPLPQSAELATTRSGVVSDVVGTHVQY
eukprot:2553514-Rhodomonas_salina.1